MLSNYASMSWDKWTCVEYKAWKMFLNFHIEIESVKLNGRVTESLTYFQKDGDSELFFSRAEHEMQK